MIAKAKPVVNGQESLQPRKNLQHCQFALKDAFDSALKVGKVNMSYLKLNHNIGVLY